MCIPFIPINLRYGLDSDETAKNEIGLFFPEFDVDAWHKEQQ